MLNEEMISSYLPFQENSAFGHQLSREDRAFLVKNSLVYQASPGTIICHQNGTEKVLYILLFGEVEVSEEVQGRKIVLGQLKSGELFGEISALFTVPRIATVTALKPTVVLEIPADKFAELIDRAPLLRELVYKKLYERSLETALRTMPVFDKFNQCAKPDLSAMLRCWQVTDQKSKTQ
ncbi:cyclic nucleotide-binding domain-containing protein [Kaarinaea lacus]